MKSGRKEEELRLFRCPAGLSDKDENQQKITVMKVAIVVVKVRSEVCGSNWHVSGWGTSLGLRQDPEARGPAERLPCNQGLGPAAIRVLSLAVYPPIDIS